MQEEYIFFYNRNAPFFSVKRHSTSYITISNVPAPINTQPMMDSLTTVPAIAAQTLYMLRYREQWIYWLIIDIASIVMWSIAENYCVVAQYVFWTLNCVYGYYLWSVKKD